MTTDTAPQGDGNFGVSGARLIINPDALWDELAFDALCLLGQALEVFEGIAEAADADELPDMHHAGLYLLRQANILVGALQMTPQQGKAVMAATAPGSCFAG